MKKCIVISITLIIIVVLPLFAGISTTKHNLGTSGPGPWQATTEDRICVFCHTPHNSNPAVWLWNHVQSSATYTPYTSPTMDATMPTSLTGSSLLCMSCHDGTIGLGETVNNGVITFPAAYDTLNATSSAYLGTDLSNDHPVSISYDDALGGGGFFPRNGYKVGNAAGDTLYLEGAVANPTVECGSCHDPHTDTPAMFLQVSNAGSNLCMICHDK